MSANVSINLAGQHEFFVAGMPAWHALGKNVEKAQTWHDAYLMAKMDWAVLKEQMSNPLTGDLIPQYALLRSDDNRYISSVGKAYRVFQNDEVFSFVDALIQTGEARFVSAGVLGVGETVFCLAELKRTFSPVTGDVHKTYLLFVDFRDGRAAQIKVTTVRVVCQNTLNMALKQSAVNGAVLKLRHTSGFDDRMKAAKVLIKDVGDEVEMISAKLAKLAKKQVTQPQFTKVMETLFPGWEKNGQAQNKVAQVATNFMSNDDGKIKNIEGSAYSLLQSVTKFIDHQRVGLRTSDSSIELKRAESAMFGAGDAFKTKALDKICNIMGVESPVVNEAVESILSKMSI